MNNINMPNKEDKIQLHREEEFLNYLYIVKDSYRELIVKIDKNNVYSSEDKSGYIQDRQKKQDALKSLQILDEIIINYLHSIKQK